MSETQQRIQRLMTTAEQMTMQGQCRDALDMLDAALMMAYENGVDCTEIRMQRASMMGDSTAAQDMI